MKMYVHRQKIGKKYTKILTVVISGHQIYSGICLLVLSEFT